MQAPVPAAPGAVWDGRFRLLAGHCAGQGGMAGAMLGALGVAAARLRDASPLPSAVLQTLPALWQDGKLAAVPHLRYYAPLCGGDLRLHFVPGMAATRAPFAVSASAGLWLSSVGPDECVGMNVWGCQAGRDTLC